MKKNFTIKIIFTIIFLLFCGFYLSNVYQYKSQILDIAISSNALKVFCASFVIVVIINLLSSYVWYQLLLDSGYRPPLINVIGIFTTSQFGKYLPGNVSQYFGRVILSKANGIPLKISINTMYFETLLSLMVGLLFCFIALFIDSNASSLVASNFGGIYKFTLLASLFLLGPWIIIFLCKKYFLIFFERFSLKDFKTLPSLFCFLKAIFLIAICFLLMGVIIKIQFMLVAEYKEVTFFLLTSYFSIAWVAGYIIPGAPAGLGVRESVILLLLSPLCGVASAVVIGIGIRLATISGDFIAFLLGMVVLKYSRSK
jgi:uncharacterized membrane protein YbhN (UPF0104 family)